MTFTDALIATIQDSVISLVTFVVAYAAFYVAQRMWRREPILEPSEVKHAAKWLVQVLCLVAAIGFAPSILPRMGWSSTRMLFVYGTLFAVIMGVIWYRDGFKPQPPQSKDDA